jgi:hypothetical protein
VSPWWSVFLAINGATGLLIAFRWPRRGYWFNLVGQLAWFAYATATRQWGFYISTVVYIVTFSILLWQAYHPKWTKERMEESS